MEKLLQICEISLICCQKMGKTRREIRAKMRVQFWIKTRQMRLERSMASRAVWCNIRAIKRNLFQWNKAILKLKYQLIVMNCRTLISSAIWSRFWKTIMLHFSRTRICQLTRPRQMRSHFHPQWTSQADPGLILQNKTSILPKNWMKKSQLSKAQKWHILAIKNVILVKHHVLHYKY